MKLLKLIILDFSSDCCNEHEITIMPTELIAVTDVTRQDFLLNRDYTECLLSELLTKRLVPIMMDGARFGIKGKPAEIIARWKDALGVEREDGAK